MTKSKSGKRLKIRQLETLLNHIRKNLKIQNEIDKIHDPCGSVRIHTFR